MLDGRLRPGPNGGSIVAFERCIDQPVETVWAALTIPERVADWLAQAEIDLKVGGRYRLRFEGGLDVMEGVIRRLEPPCVLELSWRENDGPPSILLWRLARDGDGCRLSLTHAFTTDVKDTPGFVSGWHLHLDGLAQADHGPVAWDQDRWRELDRQYRVTLTATAPTDADRFGVFLDGGRTLRFERLLPGPIERVWAWLTEPKLVAKWFTEQHVEPRVGGRMWGGFGEGDGWTATVTDWSPPHRLAWRGEDGGETVWELSAEGDLVRMVFVQQQLRPHAEVGAGWHGFFDGLHEHLAGREPPGRGALWDRILPEYRARFAALTSAPDGR